MYESTILLTCYSLTTIHANPYLCGTGTAQASTTREGPLPASSLSCMSRVRFLGLNCS